jgi:hypothetical protein
VNPTQEPAPSGGAHQQPYDQRSYDAAPQPPDAPPANGFAGHVPAQPPPGGLPPGEPEPGGLPPAGRARRRPWRRSLAVGALAAAVVAAAGVPFGLLWSWVSPSVPVGRGGQGGVVVNDPSPEQFVAADGWFTLLGVGFGVLAAITGWLILRRDRGPALLLGIVLGALGAAGVAWQVGRRLGLADYERWQQVAAAGDTFDRPPDLHAHGPLLVPAFAAVIVLTLLAGWSNDPDLDLPGARPGYGHDLVADEHGPHPDEHDPHPDPYTGYRPGPGAGGLSSGSPAGPGQTAAPAPPGSWPAGPPRG